MYKLDIGLGYSMISEIINPFADHHDLSPKISQHRVLLSNSVIEYYRKNTPSSLLGFLEVYLSRIMMSKSKSVLMSDINNNSDKQNLVELVKNAKMKTLVSKEEEFCDCKLGGIKIVTPESIYSHEDNAFNRYTFPISNHVANIDAKCDSYAAWFGHIFEGEKNIKIIDPYVLCDYGRSSLKKYYLPNISNDVDIDIYCELYKSDVQSEEELLAIIQNEFPEWNIHVHLCPQKSLHDRYIILPELQISIGAGLVFLSPCGRVTKNCSINVTTDRKIPIPIVERTLC